MNYTLNVSLKYTSLDSATGLSTLSGPFTLVISWVFLSKPLLLNNVLGISVMLVGTVLIIKCSKRETCSVYSGTALTKVAGDLWAIGSAFTYACYGVLMKWIVDENTSMSLLFGCIGISNLIFLWPLFFLFRYTLWEPVDFPSRIDQWLILTVNGLVSVFSDYFMAKAIVLTTPLVVSVGLTMSIPISLMVEVFINGEERLTLYIVGVLCLIIGFLVVNLQATQGLKQRNRSSIYLSGAGFVRSTHIFS